MTFDNLMAQLTVDLDEGQVNTFIESVSKKISRDHKEHRANITGGTLPKNVIVDLLNTYQKPRKGRDEQINKNATLLLQQIDNSTHTTTITNHTVNINTHKAEDKKDSLDELRKELTLQLMEKDEEVGQLQLQLEERDSELEKLNKLLQEKDEEKPKRKLATLATLAAIVIIAADGYSCGMIGWSAYNNPFGLAFFAITGCAIGYIAIRHLVYYEGYNKEGWQTAFGFFQVSIHLSASQIFGEWMVMMGVIVWTIGLMVSTLGVADTFKELYL